MALAGLVPSTLRLQPHPHLYEINTYAWLERMSADLGRLIQLEDVPDSTWDSIAERGFDIVWLMGVWRRSPESRRIMLEDPGNFPQFDRALPGWKPADVIASPYAVAAYVPDARIGTWDSLDRVRNKLHARGLGLFLDFVGNHTALDHPWVREHAEYYVQAQQQDYESNPSFYYPVQTPQGARFIALAKDPYYPPWKDVAQLNHFHPAGRAAQLTELRTIASHCDGVRCDMAMLLLNDIFQNGWRHLLGDTPPPRQNFGPKQNPPRRISLSSPKPTGAPNSAFSISVSISPTTNHSTTPSATPILSKSAIASTRSTNTRIILPASSKITTSPAAPKFFPTTASSPTAP